MPRPVISALTTLAALFALAPLPVAAGHQTYIALGDSLAFGEYRFQDNPSNGDRGYVGPYADFLAQFNGGVRPTVINLGVDGETTTTFLNGGPSGPGPVPGEPAYSLNTNYQPPYPSQNSLLLTTIAAEKAAGNTISTVTIQLGANDIIVLTQAPTFFTKSPSEQQGLVSGALMMAQLNLATLLAELKAQVPGANLVLLGYYDPFAPFAHDPTSPLYRVAQVSAPAIQGLDKVIATEASAFGARYIDLYTPFLGHELAYTDVANPAIPGNVHPTPAGYAVIVTQLVPEPPSLVMGATAVLAGLGSWWRRRRAISGTKTFSTPSGTQRWRLRDLKCSGMTSCKTA
jgi:lysophospholipase L1-like esterase